jgi:hypothetical protein
MEVKDMNEEPTDEPNTPGDETGPLVGPRDVEEPVEVAEELHARIQKAVDEVMNERGEEPRTTGQEALTEALKRLEGYELRATKPLQRFDLAIVFSTFHEGRIGVVEIEARELVKRIRGGIASTFILTGVGRVTATARTDFQVDEPEEV